METSLLAVLTAGGREMVMFVKNVATVKRKSSRVPAGGLKGAT